MMWAFSARIFYRGGFLPVLLHSYLKVNVPIWFCNLRYFFYILQCLHTKKLHSAGTVAMTKDESHLSSGNDSLTTNISYTLGLWLLDLV